MLRKVNEVKGEEIRSKYLQFFADRGHTVIPSHSLVPDNDPSLLLIGAGMAPLKGYFTGAATPPSKRVASCQKCVRTGDIEEVGRTARHHTFFEMLGNFSFGDYFKQQAIAWAWEFLRQHLQMDSGRLWASVYKDDQEAWDIWHKKIGLAPERIVRLGKKDNFWEIGVGPCGPCSEIYYDMGPEHGCGTPDCLPGCDCDRYLEIWNLVFTQFDKDEQGNYNPLPNPNIDTGMGLERVAAVMQGAATNYDTDLIFPLIDHFARLSGVEYADPRYTSSLRIIADHFRAVAFMLADGILPGNEGRGYVLRRLLRRAVRHGMLCGRENSFLYTGAPVLMDIFATTYPELAENRDHLTATIRAEEERFLATVEQGMELLCSYLDQVGRGGTLSGQDAFRLYDTYGFPLELTVEIAAERGAGVDREGFAAALEEQRRRARAARGQADAMGVGKGSNLFTGLPATQFTGYQRWSDNGKVLALVAENERVEKAGLDSNVLVVLDKTPFYAEGGGQVGDAGAMAGEGFSLRVEDVTAQDGIYIHHCRVEKGSVAVGDQVTAEVSSRRRAIEANHTATHLLHKALKDVVGSHVRQAGSLVEVKRLRFDFTHSKPLSSREIKSIEQQVNNVIAADLPVDSAVMSMAEARDKGAVALFGEKYQDRVRVVSVGEYSRELCGGTHVSSTAKVRGFKILAETGIGAGLRRIEAVTGDGVLEQLYRAEVLLDQAAEAAKASRDNLTQRIEELNAQLRDARQQVERLQSRVIALEADRLVAGAVDVGGVPVLACQVDSPDMASLRSQAEMLLGRLGRGIVLAATASGDRVNLVAVASKDIAGNLVDAGKLVGSAAKLVGGGGGGRPDMAQAGGKEPGGLAKMLEQVPELVRKQLEQ